MAGKRTIAKQRRTNLTNQPYNAGYFARKHQITVQQARDLIRRIGNDRDKLNAAAAKLYMS